MKHVLRAALSLLVLDALACASAPRSRLSAAEISEVLQIHAWRIPQPPSGFEWSLEVVSKLPSGERTVLGGGSALVTFRPVREDEYEFVLKQLGAQGSGTMTPCREPDDVPPVCDGYSLNFEKAPSCIGDCSKVLLAQLAPMLGGPGERWLMLLAEPSLSIAPNKKKVVVPIP